MLIGSQDKELNAHDPAASCTDSDYAPYRQRVRILLRSNSRIAGQKVPTTTTAPPAAMSG